MVYAIDFDGTLCTDRFPEIGEPIVSRLEALKCLKAAGHKLILWTCRTDEYLDAAVEFCRQFGVEFDAVNRNLPETRERWGGDTRKVYCDYYIDDKSLPETFLDHI